jgi:predicted ATPase
VSHSNAAFEDFAVGKNGSGKSTVFEGNEAAAAAYQTLRMNHAVQL